MNRKIYNEYVTILEAADLQFLFHSGSVQNNMIKCGITWRCRFIWQADVPFL